MACSNNSTATCCKGEKKFMENDAQIESNACKDVSKEKTFDLQPVSPFSSGKGLPYAPVGWPNPDDVWGWKVGRRANRSGYFVDRYLFLPRSLQLSSSKIGMFQSKPEVMRYIQTNFPNMNVEEFFALFSWQVPSADQTPIKVVQSPPISSLLKSLETGEDAKEKFGIKRKLKRKTQSCNQPTRKSFRLVHVRSDFTPVQDENEVIDLCHLNEESRVEEESGVHTAEEESPKVDMENFDDYLNTLEDILVIPYITPSDDVTVASSQDNEIECCKKKLSSLLAIDFPSLVSSNDVAEVGTLASRIRKDPNLSVDQLAKLNLVEQIPLVSAAFLEAKGNIEEADTLLEDLEGKKIKACSLKNEYIELKAKVEQSDAEMTERALTIEVINDQICQLELKRKEISDELQSMQKGKVELTTKLTSVANSIPILVHEIQLGLSKKSNWEQLKVNNSKRAAEIQEKFTNLRGLKF